MVIGEDDNFDLYGCMEIIPAGPFGGGDVWLNEFDAYLIREIVEKYAMHSKQDKTDHKILHFIWAGRTDASWQGWYQQALYQFFKAELCRNGIRKAGFQDRLQNRFQDRSLL